MSLKNVFSIDQYAFISVFLMTCEISFVGFCNFWSQIVILPLEMCDLQIEFFKIFFLYDYSYSRRNLAINGQKIIKEPN